MILRFFFSVSLTSRRMRLGAGFERRRRDVLPPFVGPDLFGELQAATGPWGTGRPRLGASQNGSRELFKIVRREHLPRSAIHRVLPAGPATARPR